MGDLKMSDESRLLNLIDTRYNMQKRLDELEKEAARLKYEIAHRQRVNYGALESTKYELSLAKQENHKLQQELGYLMEPIYT
jgi:hypothetical protein